MLAVLLQCKAKRVRKRKASVSLSDKSDDDSEAPAAPTDVTPSCDTPTKLCCDASNDSSSATPPGKVKTYRAWSHHVPKLRNLKQFKSVVVVSFYWETVCDA